VLCVVSSRIFILSQRFRLELVPHRATARRT
jgi:hypothetical protein